MVGKVPPLATVTASAAGASATSSHVSQQSRTPCLSAIYNCKMAVCAEPPPGRLRMSFKFVTLKDWPLGYARKSDFSVIL